MEITGEIKELIFQNEINSYTIAVLSTEIEELTVVGYLPFIAIGDTLRLEGKYVTHSEYGRQFKIDTFEKIMPETIESLERYLGNGTIKGVGPAIAKRIVNYFGEETMYVLKFEPKKLANVKGISKDKAIEISAQFNENWELWQIVGFLEKFGIGVQNAKNVYKALGVNAVQEIEKNPYILIDVANNVDFKIIDKIAIDMGISYNNEKRIRSGIKYSLIRATYNGHCAVVKDNLYEFVKSLLKVEYNDIENVIINMRANKEIYIEERENNIWIYLYYFYMVEENIASKLMTLDKAKNIKKISSLIKEVKEVEKETGIFLSEKQKEAIEAINNNNVCIITGGPGTGKTTIIKTIIELYKKHNKKTVLCAPTGRAAKRMTETTGQEAKTLHRLLEIGKIEEEGNYENVDYDIAPLDADVVIIDEMSMVDIFLMNYLVKALYQGTKLILVGDVDQLPSVGPGNVLEDLINSNKINTITLNKIFRQAAKSKIIINSHRINKGDFFVNKDENEQELNDDFYYIKSNNQENILKEVISLCNGRLKKVGDYDFFKNIQVISPTKKGLLGTKDLNKALQDVLNPKNESKSEKNVLGIVFRIGDKVMQIKNNYDIFWEKKGSKENGSGVFNGELGIIEKIDDVQKQIMVKFDDEKIVWYQYSELDQLEHAYAITVHKAQGSEFDVVIIPISPSAPILLTRNLLYTGMTRAKKLLIIVGFASVIEFMIENENAKKRNTGLEFKLKNWKDNRFF
ncbi:MAG: ATP-dependent RecD-like DNA helicase [Clostridiales bacterium]|nr:ATP-dependent RecD-like DNA helicase [Clostridiales bacterium]